jgi:hypothetical protein
VSGMGTVSMEKMAEDLLRLPGIEKPRRISTSDWDASQLSIDQIQYATLDAHLSFLLGVKLVARSPLTVRANRISFFECNMVFGVGGEKNRLYTDHKLDWEGGSDLEDSEKDESDSYSGGSSSVEYAW